MNSVFWALTEHSIKRILGSDGLALEEFKRRFDQLPSSEREVFYNIEPLDLAADLAGTSPTAAQTSTYLAVKKSFLDSFEKSKDEAYEPEHLVTFSDFVLIMTNVGYKMREVTNFSNGVVWEAADDSVRRGLHPVITTAPPIGDGIDQGTLVYKRDYVVDVLVHAIGEPFESKILSAILREYQR